MASTPDLRKVWPFYRFSANRELLQDELLQIEPKSNTMSRIFKKFVPERLRTARIQPIDGEEEFEVETRADTIRGTAAIIRRLSLARIRMEHEELRLSEERCQESSEPGGEYELVYEWDGLRRRRSLIGSQRARSMTSSSPAPPTPHPPLGWSHFPTEEELAAANRPVSPYLSSMAGTIRSRARSVLSPNDPEIPGATDPSKVRSPVHPVQLTEIVVPGQKDDAAPARRQFSFANIFQRHQTHNQEDNDIRESYHRPVSSRSYSNPQTGSATEEERLGLVKSNPYSSLSMPALPKCDDDSCDDDSNNVQAHVDGKQSRYGPSIAHNPPRNSPPLEGINGKGIIPIGDTITNGNEVQFRGSIYRPLRHDTSEIRLLTLKPLVPDTTSLECTISHVPLPQAARLGYIALSYRWGDPAVTASITVNGVAVQVTVNLVAALRRLQAAEVYTVWADALCINQTDNQEKSLQVPRIGTIFSKAHEVVVWLGDESGVDEASQEHLRARRAPEPGPDTCLSALPVFHCLLSRAYWRRVWIIQELAVASRIRLYCGSYEIPWKAIDASCHCCERVDFTNTQGRRADESISRFLMLRKIRTNIQKRRPIRLMEALYYTRSSLATDPRDKIFALLGLAYDGKYFVPEPNYMDSVSNTFIEFAISLLISDEPLDFIYLRSASRKVDGELPSWVPDWADLNDPVAHRQFDYIMAQSSRTATDPDSSEDVGLSVSDFGWNARGILVDTVDGLGSALTTDPGDSPAHEVTMPRTLTVPYDSEDELSSIVYRTLSSTELSPNAQYETADRLDQDLHRFWDMATPRQQLGERASSLPLDISDSIFAWLAENRTFRVYGRTLESWTDACISSGVKDNAGWDAACFLHAIRSCMRLLVTERGYIGWAHPQARRGDKIAILLGCKKPVILRPWHRGYRIVGDACLSGKSTEDLWSTAAQESRTILIV